MLSRAARAVALRWSVPSAALVLVAVVALARAMSAEPLPPARAATALERQQFDARVAAREVAWRAKSVGAFPGDHWSQDDDFHSTESAFVRREARRLGVRLSGLLLAIDAGLHAAAVTASSAPTTSGASRQAAVVPCKPRPVYD
jgi:hypothetical protein